MGEQFWSAMNRFSRKLNYLMRREPFRNDLVEELEFHSAKKVEGYRADGLPPTEAAAKARRELGNVGLAADECHDIRGFPLLEQFIQDIRYSLRLFQKYPAFTIVAVLSLALGIAGNTAVFSMINAILLKPLPFADPDRLVRITEFYPKALLVYFQQHSRTMDIAAVSPGTEMNVTGQGPAFRITASNVSANLMEVLGAHVERGRPFAAGEGQAGRDRIAILSHELWTTRFHSDPDIIGRLLTINGMDRQIVGVLPPQFRFPSPRVQIWLPAVLDPSDMEDYWGSEFVPLIGRLRSGATLEQAKTEVHSLAAPIWRMFPFPMPHNFNASASVMSLQRDLAGDARGRLLVLLSAVGTVLVIACANVASLLMARATTRRREIALRAALGAGRSRIVRQLLIESVVLAMGAGAAGALLGGFALTIFRSALPSEMVGAVHVTIDWTVAAFAALLSLAAGISFGIVPALGASRLDLVEAFKTGGLRSTTRSSLRFRSWLIAGEVALTLVLVIGASLLIRSLYALSMVDPGFNPHHILTAKISPDSLFCAQRDPCVEFYSRFLEEAYNVPGVVDAALASTVPLDGTLPSVAVDIQGHPKTADFPAPMLWTGAITPGYLRLMHIPLLAGRAFTIRDTRTSEPVLLITASTARRFWPGEDPIGKHIKVVWEPRWRTIIGVVPDVRQHNLANRVPASVRGAIYMPYSQAVGADHRIPAVMNLIVKSAGSAQDTAEGIRQLAAARIPNIPVGKVQALEQLMDESVANVRSMTWLFLSFAAVALILATIGIYGLVSYSVVQRTYEISLRIALGATTRGMIGMMLIRSLRIVAGGTAAGLIIAFLATRALSALLYNVAPADPVVYASVSAVLISVSALASFVPAWRVSRIDPVRNLRAE